MPEEQAGKGVWGAKNSTFANAMESDRCCYAASLLVATLPVVSILNTLNEAADAVAQQDEGTAGPAQFVLCGCGAGCLSICVLLSVLYNPGR